MTKIQIQTLENPEDVTFEKRPVLGLFDVAKGVKILIPTTIYEVSGEDTSGVAGLLFPNGEFILALPQRTQQMYWDFDSPADYAKDETGRVKGNAWRTGEVLWDGSHVGGIDIAALDGDAMDEVRSPVMRRKFDASLAEDLRETTCELWKAVRRNTSMR